MAPRLQEGDWLLVDPDAFRTAPPRNGDLVLAAQEGGAEPGGLHEVGLLVKRVAGVFPDGTVRLVGDAPSSGEHRHDAIVLLATISGQPWFRYWPPHRIGRVR